jgi:hypothetical protein
MPAAVPAAMSERAGGSECGEGSGGGKSKCNFTKHSSLHDVSVDVRVCVSLHRLSHRRAIAFTEISKRFQMNGLFMLETAFRLIAGILANDPSSPG